MPWISFIPTFARTVITAYRQRRFLQKWWKRLLISVNLGKTNILVTGQPSTGKSVLTATLYSESSNIDYMLPGTSTTVETKAITLGDWTKVVRVVPGQVSAERDRGIHDAFDSDELQGILHVVDWGYTKPRDLAIQARLIEQGIDSIQNLRDYYLKLEIKELEYVCSRIREAHSINKGPKWLIIAINKVDLFRDRLNAAESYYNIINANAFTTVVNDMLKHVGQNNLKVMTVPVCAWEDDFEWNEIVIKTNLGGTQYKHELLRNIILNIARLSS